MHLPQDYNGYLMQNLFNELPKLYSFRRCPYAIRTRMAIALSQVKVELREIKLSNKPLEMLKASPKGTVPVLVLPRGKVLEESLDIMNWALSINDPENIASSWERSKKLICINDGDFKYHLDRYKYEDRYPAESTEFHKEKGEEFLALLDQKLHFTDYLLSSDLSFADIAILPFIRQWANVDSISFNELPYGKLQRWLTRMLESKPFIDVMDKYPLWSQKEAGIAFPSLK